MWSGQCVIVIFSTAPSLRTEGDSNDIRMRSAKGFTLLEVMIVMALGVIIAAIAIPMSGNALGFFRLSGDARALSNSVALSKMRAASIFGKVRLFVDLGGKTYHLETFDSTSAICCWHAEGGTSQLSTGVSFSHGVVSTAPPNTQGTIGQAPLCKSDEGADVANTACIIFNSRGAPVDSSGAPIVDALYVTDGTAVYGTTVSATGMVRTWRTLPNATPSWGLQ